MNAGNGEARGLDRRWEIAAPDGVAAGGLAESLRISPVTARCLLNRGLRDPDLARGFLEPRLSRLADPFEIPDLERTARRLLDARARNERVLIFGDYDVDGISSVALLTEVFQQLGIRSNHYLPHRADEGYGLTAEAVESALREFPAEVLVAVDCGSSAAEVVNRLVRGGIDVIVIDHHQPGDPPPEPRCFVNPRRCAGGKGDSQELCSVGLAFKLAHGLVKVARELNLPGAASCDVRQWLDFAALGTVADLVPLTGENRILVAAGTARLNGTRRPGLEALVAAAGIRREIGVSEIGFQIGPRLNAAGRLESATRALRLLLTRDPVEARELAAALDEQNRLRREIETKILDEVLGRVRPAFDSTAHWVIIEGDSTWHIGVIGIVAARVLREFHRPVIILGGGPPWRGSGRSIEGFDLGAALRECGELLLRHGGHAMAAGVTLDPEACAAFRDKMNGIARERLTPENLRPSLRLDGVVRLGDMSPGQIAEFARLGPFGQGHPPVQLVARNLRLRRPVLRMGAEGRHARLSLTDGESEASAVYWNAGANQLPSTGDEFDVAFVPELNTFRGATEVRLRLLDWRKSAA